TRGARWPDLPAAGDAQQDVGHRVLGPGERDVIAVADAFLGLQERNRAWLERTIKLVTDSDAFVAQDAREFVVVAFGIGCIGADEEAGAVLGNPRGELVNFAVKSIEQDHAANALAEAADLQ